jgi:hypothetical protein
MVPPPPRRCAIWVSRPTLVAAQELADSAGVDVDTFVEYIVNELRECETRAGALRKWAGASASVPASVISISSERQRRQRRQG